MVQTGAPIGRFETATLVNDVKMNPVVNGFNNHLDTVPLGWQVAPGIKGILDQVQQDLLDLRAIRQHPAVVGQTILDVDGGRMGHHADDQVPRFLGNERQVNRRAHGATFFGEMANALHDATRPLGFTHDLGAGFADGLRRQAAAVLAAQHGAGIGADGGQWLVQFMRQVARQFAQH